MYNPDSTAPHCFPLWSNKQPDLKQPHITRSKILSKDIVQAAFFYDLTQYKICSYPETATSGSPVFAFRKLCIGEIFQEILIRFHEFRIRIWQFSDRYSFEKSILPGWIINPVILILYIYNIWLFLRGICLLQLVLSLKIQIHSALFRRLST